MGPDMREQQKPTKKELLDAKPQEALKRLVQNVDFKVYVEHLEKERAMAEKALANAPAHDIFPAQGRVQAYNHILGVIKNVEK